MNEEHAIYDGKYDDTLLNLIEYYFYKDYPRHIFPLDMTPTMPA